jgi:hypothetical protein
VCVWSTALFSESYGDIESVLTYLGLGTKQSKLEHDLTASSLLSTVSIGYAGGDAVRRSGPKGAAAARSWKAVHVQCFPSSLGFPAASCLHNGIRTRQRKSPVQAACSHQHEQDWIVV